MVDARKQRCVGYNRSQDTLFTGSNPVLTTKNKIMCNITPLEAIGICAIIFIIAGIYMYIKSDGMGIE